MTFTVSYSGILLALKGNYPTKVPYANYLEVKFNYGRDRMTVPYVYKTQVPSNGENVSKCFGLPHRVE